MLPGQRIGSGAWASATFHPALEVKIIGPRLEMEQSLRQPLVRADGAVMGRWIHDLAGSSSHRITFVKKDGVVFMLRTFVGKQGDSATDAKTLEALGPNRYRYPGSKSTWMTINGQGDLELHDQHGYVDTARQVD